MFLLTQHNVLLLSLAEVAKCIGEVYCPFIKKTESYFTLAAI